MHIYEAPKYSVEFNVRIFQMTQQPLHVVNTGVWTVIAFVFAPCTSQSHSIGIPTNVLT